MALIEKLEEYVLEDADSSVLDTVVEFLLVTSGTKNYSDIWRAVFLKKNGLAITPMDMAAIKETYPNCLVIKPVGRNTWSIWENYFSKYYMVVPFFTAPQQLRAFGMRLHLPTSVEAPAAFPNSLDSRRTSLLYAVVGGAVLDISKTAHRSNERPLLLYESTRDLFRGLYNAVAAVDSLFSSHTGDLNV